MRDSPSILLHLFSEGACFVRLHYFRALLSLLLIDTFGNRAADRVLIHAGRTTTEQSYPVGRCITFCRLHHEAQLGTIREIVFIKMLKNSGYKICYNEAGDFSVDNKIFEIGGKQKDKKQIKKAPDTSWLVKDAILYGS